MIFLLLSLFGYHVYRQRMNKPFLYSSAEDKGGLCFMSLLENVRAILHCGLLRRKMLNNVKLKPPAVSHFLHFVVSIQGKPALVLILNLTSSSVLNYETFRQREPLK